MKITANFTAIEGATYKLIWDPLPMEHETHSSFFNAYLKAGDICDDDPLGVVVESPETPDEIADFSADFSLACATYGDLWDGGEYILSEMLESE
jgi:hypothetical protein